MTSISINWTIANPPSAPSTWKSISPSKVSTIPRDLALELAPGTNDFLRCAFEQGFTRSCGWLSDHPAAKDAASIFKRGVALNHLDKDLSLVSGTYHIDFLSHQNEIEKIISAKDYFVIVDRSVQNHWPGVIKKIPHSHIVEIDEITKNLDTVADIMFASGQNQKWICIGGGVLTDTAAMAAALKSAEITFVPTTLLAMADACVGGKTGVNFAPFGKNQVGRFYFPMRVLIWEGWLQTLDRRHITGGACEGIKHALLSGDLTLYQKIFDTLADPSKKFISILPKIVDFKAKIVSQDATESGIRATLNLGHTLAHAIESLSQKNNPQSPISHGEAVGIGLVYALFVSHYECEFPIEFCQTFALRMSDHNCLIRKDAFEKFLGSPLNNDTFNEIIEITKTDKKAEPHSVYWVLLNSFGHPYCENNLYKKTASIETLLKSWDHLISAMS